MHRGSKIRDLPYPSRTVPEVSGVWWCRVFWHQQRACWAAARSRSWQSAASMDVGNWNGGKGGKFETKCGMCISPNHWDLWPMNLNYFGCCPLRWPFAEYCSEIASLFCNGSYRIKHFERRVLGWRYSTLSCTLVIPVTWWWCGMCVWDVAGWNVPS